MPVTESIALLKLDTPSDAYPVLPDSFEDNL
jgi:hypothetical protein